MKFTLKNILLVVLTLATLYSFYLHYQHNVDITNTFDRFREIYNLLLEMTGSDMRLLEPASQGAGNYI